METAPTQRLTSLDALRGFDMFWILGADSLAYALHEMSDNPATKFFAEQLDHAEWAGFRFYDLIFPLFVFIMGVSTVFSLEKIIVQEGRGAAVKRVLKRGVLLFIVALIYSGGFTNPWPDMRLMGVLNRIALCYTFGGLLFIFCNVRVMMAVAVALLLGYWALLAQVPFPDVRPTPGGDAVITKEAGFKKISDLNLASTTMIHGSYIQGVNLANYLDQKYLPGRKYDGTYDPEGILSTLPALVTGLLGIFTGLFLRLNNFPEMKKVIWLFSAGAASAALGWLWNLEMPVIKKLWTSSYVLVAGGYSAMLLAVFYFIVDVKKWQTWCQPFIWIGMNPITLYLTSNFLGGLGFEKLARRLTGGPVKNFFDTHIAAGCGELVSSLVGVLLFIWFARFLYQRKIFLRL
jgi:predicted acyltransferase